MMVVIMRHTYLFISLLLLDYNPSKFVSMVREGFMRAVDIIIKKRDRQRLTAPEIDFFIQGYARGDIPDYQAAAWAMAVLLNGMNPEETTDLVMAMARSGKILDLSQISLNSVDKHSTGGVGDKTTLVVGPVAAACGLKVGKMSGRGLGFSGGTLDKMESIPGFRSDLSIEEFLSQLNEIGLVLAGQSANLAPADGKLYSLRDVTGTVQSIPLIASSIMSKKIAGGAQAIVLDVKTGLGAFMHTLDEARQLAELMVEIARLSGRKATAILSDMNQPLGHAVGNALEVREAIETLNGGGPADFREHCLLVASHMLALTGTVHNEDEGRGMAQKALDGGQALDRFRSLVAVQGGDVSCIDNPDLLPSAAHVESVLAETSGWVAQVHARLIGEMAVLLGAGRSKKGDPIDHAVGIEVLLKVGDRVEPGKPLFKVHAGGPERLKEAVQSIQAAITFSETPVEPLPLIYGVVKQS
jgi:pyrimidine-nucleoside phosphorylase